MFALQVVLEVRGVGRLVGALRAAEGPLSGVCAHVLAQLGRVAESLAALGTGVGEAAVVRPLQVPLQKRGVSGTEGTVATLQRFGGIAGGGVIRREAGTGRGHRGVVLQAVCEEGGLLAETLTARLACERHRCQGRRV